MGKWIQLEVMPEDPQWAPDPGLPERLDDYLRTTLLSFRGRLNERTGNTADSVRVGPTRSDLSSPPANYIVSWDICPYDAARPVDEPITLRAQRQDWVDRVEGLWDAIDDGAVGISPQAVLLGLEPVHGSSAASELIAAELIAGQDMLLTFNFGDTVVVGDLPGPCPLPNILAIAPPDNLPRLRRPDEWGIEMGGQRPFGPRWTQGVFRGRLHFVWRDDLFWDFVDLGLPAPCDRFLDDVGELFGARLAYNWDLEW